MPQGGVDCSAFAKSVGVVLIASVYLLQNVSLIRLCQNSSPSIGISDCRTPTWNNLGQDGPWAIMYACIYGLIVGISMMGCCMLLCESAGSQGYTKLYAALLVFCALMLTGAHGWLVFVITGDKPIDMASLVGDSLDSRNYEIVGVVGRWLLEVWVFTNAAYDAWDRSDQGKIDLHDLV